METTTRFNEAVKKLYAAFHEDTLIPECNCQCAVGSILDGKEAWKHFSDRPGSTTLNFVGRVHQNLGRRFQGYTPSELLQIEAAFLKGCGYSLPLDHQGTRPENPTDKDTLFNGLAAVVEQLCDLDGIPNVMDCQQLFSYSHNPPTTVGSL